MCEYCDLNSFHETHEGTGELSGPAFKGESGEGSPGWLVKDEWGWILKCNGAMWETGEVRIYHCPWRGEKLAD